MKKSLILITAFITASAAFGQNAKSAGVTKEDVQSWIKNQKQIEQNPSSKRPASQPPNASKNTR